MTEAEKVQNAWEKDLALGSIARLLRWDFSMEYGVVKAFDIKEYKSQDEWIRILKRYSQKMPDDITEDLNKKIEYWVKNYESKPDKIAKQSHQYLVGLSDDLFEEVNPESSLEKTYGFLKAIINQEEFSPLDYETMILLRDEISEELLKYITEDWSNKLRASIERQKKDKVFYNNAGPSYRFWAMDEGYETIYDIAIYRFIEAFDLDIFEKSKAQIHDGFKYGEHSYEDLWLISRSPELFSNIKHNVEVSINKVVHTQHDEGYWHRGISDKGELIPDVRRTATATLSILRMASDQRHLDSAKKAIEWLQRNQDRGVWMTGPPDKREPSILNTLLATQAIRMGGVKGNKYIVENAEDWIMGQQDKNGTWSEKRSYGNVFLSTLVYEYFEQPPVPILSLNNYMDMARGFLLRSREVINENNKNATRLAVISGCQGLESLVYGCLTKDELGISIYGSQNRTIGLGSAIGKLQQYFQKEGYINHGENLAYKPSIDKLIYYRNEIVHKSISVDYEESGHLLRDAVRFANMITLKIFGYKII